MPSPLRTQTDHKPCATASLEGEAMIEYDAIAMSQRLLYQVTLASGRIVTNPDDFGNVDVTAAEDYFRPIFSEDGRLLTVVAEAERVMHFQEQPQPEGA